MPDRTSCAATLTLAAVPGLPIVQRGDDLAALIAAAMARASMALLPGDVLVVTSKVVSRAEGRFVDLAQIEPSARALELATRAAKDPRLVELILRESTHVSRVTRQALIVRHRLGFVVANAGIDQSNAQPAGAEPGSGPWALLLPEDPDGSARRLRDALAGREASAGVILSDSFGRPFRMGTVGVAIGAAGIPPLWDRRGEDDLFGRKLEQTITALVDQVAAAADLVAGQAAEGRAVVLVRGLTFAPGGEGAAALIRPAEQDLYA